MYYWYYVFTFFATSMCYYVVLLILLCTIRIINTMCNYVPGMRYELLLCLPVAVLISGFLFD